MRLIDVRRAQSRAPAAQRPRDFVAQAFPIDRANTRHVALVRVRATPVGWRAITITKVPGERARQHVQLVQPPSGYRGRFRRCEGVRLDCDCMRYQFVWNYALDHAALAVLDRTNGDPADVTNPDNRTGCCKHCVLLLQYLIAENPAFPHANAPSTDGRGAIRLRSVRETR